MALRLVKPRQGHQPCWQCGKPRTLVEKHDAYACAYCNIWLEPNCDDKQCEFCKDKPRKPNIFQQ